MFENGKYQYRGRTVAAEKADISNQYQYNGEIGSENK